MARPRKPADDEEPLEARIVDDDEEGDEPPPPPAAPKTVPLWVAPVAVVVGLGLGLACGGAAGYAVAARTRVEATPAAMLGTEAAADEARRSLEGLPRVTETTRTREEWRALLVGKTTRQVVHMLGNPDQNIPPGALENKDTVWTYNRLKSLEPGGRIWPWVNLTIRNDKVIDLH